jgi:competence protein ComEC
MHRGAGLPVVTSALVAGQMAVAVREPPYWGIGAVVIAALLVAWGRPGARPAALLLAAGLAAFALGAARGRAALYPSLPPDHVALLELPLRATLVGRIVVPPEHRRRQTILVVEVEELSHDGVVQRTQGRVRMAVRRPGRRWRYGDRLRATTTLRLPRNFENPGRFDYVGHLARRGVYVTAFVWEPASVRRLPAPRHGWRLRLERWRARVAALIAARVPPPGAAVLQALVLGDQGGIDTGLREAFTRAGVVHVLSVSGLHVALVAAGAFAIIRGTLGRSERLLIALPVAPLAAVLALGPVAVYSLLAGLGVPVLRAAVMVVAATAGQLFGRSVDPLRSLVVAALVLALAFPAGALDAGAQLSFVSVAAICLGARRLATAEERAATWRDALVASPCALVGTAPLTAFHFGQVSLIGVAANPVVVPIFGSAVVLLGLSGAVLEPVSTGLAAASFVLAGLLLRVGVAAVTAFAAFPGASVGVRMPTPVELILLYVLLAGLLCRGVARRAVVALAIAGLLADAACWRAHTLGPRSLRVTFLDVGQGDAAVVELPGGRTLVVDAGGFPAGEFDTGEAVVSPFLRQRGILRPDALIMTHAHPDHAGGLASLLRRHRPREFWWTGVPGGGRGWRRLEREIAASGARVRVLSAGARLPDFARGIHVLHPDDPQGLSLNDSSLTLRLEAEGGAALLTGDIEAAAERRLLRAPDALASDVLKVPHHGSRTSSGPAFVTAVGPDIAVMSVGADNRYRLPAADVEARYRAAGACVLRTDRCGAITVTLGDGPPRVWTRRPGCGCEIRSAASARASARTSPGRRGPERRASGRCW